jgi:hypothetical protein
MNYKLVCALVFFIPITKHLVIEPHLFLNLMVLYQIKEDKMGIACSTNGEKRNAWRLVGGKPEKTMSLEDQDVCG